MRGINKSLIIGAMTRLLRSLGIAAGIVLLLVFLTPAINTTFMVDEALAAGSASQQGNGKMLGGGQGGKNGQGGQTTGIKGGAKGVKDAILADEEDPDESDRPPWAGGNTGENPHMPADKGGGKPDSAGTMRGDDYGDLIVLVRDPETGAPILDEETGQPLVCLDVDCNESVPMTEEGDVPEGVIPVEVDFGRASSTRSPNHVTNKALTDALDKLTAEGVTLSLDTAGRISYTTADGVTSTIDSPLENMALYVDLLTGLADKNVKSATEDALGQLATLDTAASLLAAVADKTGDISIDYVVYINVIADIVESGEFYDYSDFTKGGDVYTRSYPTDYEYYYDDGSGVTTKILDINAYLEDVNGALPTGDDLGAASLFAAAADDALEVIELIHTQIHTVELPGTVTP